MVKSTTVSGRKTTCTELEFTYILMGLDMMASMIEIKSRAMDSTGGLTVAFTKVGGLMGSSTD